MPALGDFKLGSTIYDYFTTTAAATGAPTVLSGTPVVSVYEDDSNTQITAGITLGVDADAVVGLNRLTIVATTANGYEVGKQYTAVITTGTVGGTSAVGYVVSSFSIEKTGLNISNISYSDGAVPALGIIDSGTAQSAGATSLQLRSAATFGDDNPNGATLFAYAPTPGYWQARQVTDYVNSTDTATVDAWGVTPSGGTIIYIMFGTPPAVASGTLPSVTVGSGGITTASFAAGAINAAAIAADAITDAKVASDVTIASVTGAVGSVTGAVGSVTGAVGSVTGAVGSVTGNVGGNVVGTVGTVNAIAANAITAAATAADFGTEIGAAVLAAAAADPIDANVEQVNAVTITGNGVSPKFGV